jgi:penicillin-binding protein 1C
MQELGMTGATLLPDVELQLPTPHGAYAPRNYDGRFHGPVRLREALASSLNVPAVHTAARVGPERVLQTLRAVGIRSLELDGAHYGAAIALGDGEVKLAELALAYSVLARGGLYRPLRYALEARQIDGRMQRVATAAPERVLDARIASVLADILSDDAARAASFGRGSVLELPFAVAAKTGTSKGSRDNWTIGFTREVTVAVWVGNFDGRPMRHTSGVTGAGPLFRGVMLAAMRGREPAALVDRNGLIEIEICALSGKRPGHHCPHRTRELFAAGDVPATSCDVHVELAVDPENGLLAGPGCKRPELRVFES